jgi:hypothetical protein
VVFCLFCKYVVNTAAQQAGTPSVGRSLAAKYSSAAAQSWQAWYFLICGQRPFLFLGPFFSVSQWFGLVMQVLKQHNAIPKGAVVRERGAPTPAEA